MRKWRFRKDLMPNAGGGVGAHGKKIEYSAIDDPFGKVYPSKTIRFRAMTQVMCGAFVSLFGLTLYIFGIKGWKTEYFVRVCLAAGTSFILNGIWGSETAKYTSQWKIVVNIAMSVVSTLLGLAVVIASCTSIPVEFRALDEGLIREYTHMKARVVLIILAFMADLLCLVTSVSIVRVGFRALMSCCDDDDDESLDESTPVML